MSTMSDWARDEIELACKKENPNWDGKSFDYGCSCYQSALKAYLSIMEDGHSGSSFGFTKNILKKLLDGDPLTPITDDDFHEENNIIFGDTNDKNDGKPYRVKDIQCRRKSGLFKEVYSDNSVKYHDLERQYCRNIEDGMTFTGSAGNIVDEMFPISMPYMGCGDKNYEVGVIDFLCDEKNGDFDHQGVIYVKEPNGNIIPVNDHYFRETDNGWCECSESEFFNDYLHRLDKLSIKSIEYILNDIVDYFYENVLEPLHKPDDYGFYRKYNMPKLIERFETEYKEFNENILHEIENQCIIFDLFPYLNRYSFYRDIINENKSLDQVIKHAIELNSKYKDIPLYFKFFKDYDEEKISSCVVKLRELINSYKDKFSEFINDTIKVEILNSRNDVSE